MLLSTCNLFVACVAYFAIGFAGVVTGIVTMAFYQACVPSEYMGRVQAIRYMLSAAIMPAAQLSADVFKSALGVQGTYILASVLVVCSSI